MSERDFAHDLSIAAQHLRHAILSHYHGVPELTVTMTASAVEICGLYMEMAASPSLLAHNSHMRDSERIFTDIGRGIKWGCKTSGVTFRFVSDTYQHAYSGA